MDQVTTLSLAVAIPVIVAVLAAVIAVVAFFVLVMAGDEDAG